MPSLSPLSQFISGSPSAWAGTTLGQRSPGAPLSVNVAEAAARKAMRLDGPELDEAWKAYLRWDASMGGAGAPDPARMDALAHPRAAMALDFAREAVETFPDLLVNMIHTSWRESGCLSGWTVGVALARDSIQALGMSFEMADALLGMAFGKKSVESFCLAFIPGTATGFVDKRPGTPARTDTLGTYDKEVRKGLLTMSSLRGAVDWGGNAMLAEAAFGALGAYGHRVFLSAANSHVSDGDIESAYRPELGEYSPALSRACKTLGRLCALWDMETDAPMPPRHAVAIVALCELAQAAIEAETALGSPARRVAGGLEAKEFEGVLALAKASEPRFINRVGKVGRSRA